MTLVFSENILIVRAIVSLSMFQLCLLLVSAVILTGPGIALDIPFVFDKNYSNLADYDSNQLNNASALSRDLEGVPPVSSPDNYDMIEVDLVTKESINTSSYDNETTKPQKILSGLVTLNLSTVANATNVSDGFGFDLDPEYSLRGEEYWFNIGNIYYNKMNYQKAIECYEKAIEINSQLKEAWYNEGIALGKLGKYQDAIKAFDQALSISPDYSNALRNKDLALKAMRREDKS